MRCMEQFANPPTITLDARTSVREALIAGMRTQIAPLADQDLTGTGRSFLEEAGIDSARLLGGLPLAVIRAVEQVATARPALAPLAAQLNADALLTEVRALRSEAAPRTPAGPGGFSRLEARGDVFRLVDALLQLESIADEGERREVLRQLPTSIAGAIPYHAVPRVQVLALLRTCLGYPGGLQKLLAAVRLIEQDSNAMRQLDSTALAVFPGLFG